MHHNNVIVSNIYKITDIFWKKGNDNSRRKLNYCNYWIISLLIRAMFRVYSDKIIEDISIT